MTTAMTSKAQKYVIPEKRQPLAAQRSKTPLTNKANPNFKKTEEPQNSLNSNTQRKKDEKLLDSYIAEESDAADSSNQSFALSDGDNESLAKSPKKVRNELPPRVLAHLSTIIHPNSGQSDSSSAEPKRTVSVIGRKRYSTIDPSTIKQLKDIKLETLKQDDQIEKEFEERNPTDINFLIKCTENVGFFKKYDEDTHKQCMAKMYHVHLKQGDTCMNHGEFGETFWVTLKGRVAILIPLEKEIVDKNGESRKEKVLTKVAAQGTGYAFGELALLERKPRAATIICEEDSDFAVLDKEPFQQILRAKEEERLFNEVNFLKSLQIFKEWSYNSIRSLFMYCRLREATRNQIIYHQNEPAEHMYIIKSGDFRILSKFDYQEEVENTQDNVAVRKYLKKKLQSRDIELSILGRGEIFGAEELIEGRRRMHSVVCSQDGAFIQINKKEFESLILPEPTTSSWLIEYLEYRAKIHAKRMQKIVASTQSFKNYLIHTASVSSSKLQQQKDVSKSSERKLPAEKPLHIRPNRNVSAQEAEEDHSEEKPGETHHLVAQHEHSEITEHGLREIRTKRWKQNEWEVIKNPFAAFEGYGVDYHTLKNSWSLKRLEPMHSTEAKSTKESHHFRNSNPEEPFLSKNKSTIATEDSFSQSPVRYVPPRMSTTDPKAKHKYLVNKYRTPIRATTTSGRGFETSHELSSNNDNEDLSPQRRFLNKLGQLSNKKHPNHPSDNTGILEEHSKHDLDQISKSNEEDIIKGFQRQPELEHMNISSIEDTESVPKAELIKKIIDAETRVAIRNKLNLNSLNLVSFDNFGNGTDFKGIQTLYNQTITSANTIPKLKLVIEKKPSSGAIRLKQRVENIREISNRIPTTKTQSTKRSDTLVEKNHQILNAPAETSNILDQSQFTISRHTSPRLQFPSHSAEKNLRKTRHRNLTGSYSKYQLPALSLRTEEPEYSNPNTRRVFVQRGGRLERKGFNPGHTFSLDEKSFKITKIQSL